MVIRLFWGLEIIYAVYRVSTSISKDPIAINADDPNAAGELYVVATPIGNLADISQRALEVLSRVECILAEDTRHSKRLLNHYGISTTLRSCHEHNESKLIAWVMRQLDAGTNLALISDAGTPLISDPGFVLVRALREGGHRVTTVPGASSIIAALSIAGLPTDGFIYDGFLSAKSTARRAQYTKYKHQARTVVLLESSHRIIASVNDLITELGGDRTVVLARELTKRFETVLSGTAQEIADMLNADVDQTRGEFVIMIAGAPVKPQAEVDLEDLLIVLLAEVTVKQAASMAAKVSGRRKNDVYELALKIKSSMPD